MDRGLYDKLSADRNAIKHSNIYIHNILSVLKKNTKPVSFKEIEKETGVNIERIPGLLDILNKNKKIVRRGETLEFIPTYTINSEKELLNILKETNSEHGIPLEEILDSSSSIKPFVDSLVEKQRGILLKDMDGSQVLFYNSLTVDRASAEIQKLYDAISVPETRDLVKELASAGLSAKPVEKPAKRFVPVQRKRKYTRKIKITNTHIDSKELGM